MALSKDELAVMDFQWRSVGDLRQKVDGEISSGHDASYDKLW